MGLRAVTGVHEKRRTTETRPLVGAEIGLNDSSQDRKWNSDCIKPLSLQRDNAQQVYSSVLPFLLAAPTPLLVFKVDSSRK